MNKYSGKYCWSIKVYIPNQLGIRNPAFASVISVVEYVGNLEEVERIAQHAVNGEVVLRQKPVEVPVELPRRALSHKVETATIDDVSSEKVEAPNYTSYEGEISDDSSESKDKITDRIRGFFGNMFE